MITQSFIPEKLKDFEYYKQKLPVYLQNSFSFQEHFRIIYDSMINIENGSMILLNLVRIFDNDYLEYARVNVEEYNENELDALDLIGGLFGVNRHLSVTYTYNGVTTTESLSLNNEEFLILIKGQIIKNYCDGSYEQINNYYKDVGLNMYVQTSDSEVATANVYLDKTPVLDNVDKLFLSGLLLIKSMGIQYRTTFLDVSRLLTWDVSKWDVGQWGI